MKFSNMLAAPVLALTLLGVPQLGLADTSRQITVTGEGQVTAVPDMASISLGVQSRDKDPQAAMTRTAEAAQRVVARLKEMGVAPRDLQTSTLALRQLESYGPGEQRKIEGYEASNQLRVRVRDLDQLGAVLSAVLSDGANVFSGLSFELSEPEAAQNEARKAAVADALAKAALYAEAAGVELGQVLSISEAHDQPVPMMRMEMAGAAMDMPVEAGEVSLNQRVTLVIDLQ